MADSPHTTTSNAERPRARVAAQAAADRARQVNLAAREAVDTTSAADAEVRDAARGALTASVIGLRDAVAALAVLGPPELPGAAPRIDVTRAGDSVTVRPHGELDLLTCPYLEQLAVVQIGGDDAAADLVVDLSQVTFLDSSALAVLVEVNRVAGENATGFLVTGLTPRQRRLFEITRLDHVLRVV